MLGVIALLMSQKALVLDQQIACNDAVLEALAKLPNLRLEPLPLGIHRLTEKREIPISSASVRLSVEVLNQRHKSPATAAQGVQLHLAELLYRSLLLVHATFGCISSC